MFEAMEMSMPLEMMARLMPKAISRVKGVCWKITWLRLFQLRKAPGWSTAMMAMTTMRIRKREMRSTRFLASSDMAVNPP